MKKNIKTFWIILFSVFAVLLVLRIALSPILLHYAQKKLNSIPEFCTSIESVSVNLYRGSYAINHIKMEKINKKIPVPFFAADKVEFAIEWRPLLHGKLVGKIITTKPNLNFVTDSKHGNEQLSMDAQWQKAVSSLYPLNFNKVEAHDGKITFRSFTGNPPFNLYLQNVNFKIENMHNASRKSDSLPSTFTLDANSMNHGNVKAKAQFNPFTKSPTFYLTSDLKAMNITEANSFLDHYTSVKAKTGKFNLYLEIAAAKGKISGYAKPFIQDLELKSPSKNPIEEIYTGAVSILAKILTNSKQDTIATKVNFAGDIDDPSTSVLSILGYMISHAFIQTLIPQVDHTVKMQDVRYGKSNSQNKIMTKSKQG